MSAKVVIPSFMWEVPDHDAHRRAADMTMREWYASVALQGLLAWSPAEADLQYGMQEAVMDAFKFADAMLKESQREIPPSQ